MTMMATIHTPAGVSMMKRTWTSSAAQHRHKCDQCSGASRTRYTHGMQQLAATSPLLMQKNWRLARS
eukprot:12924965-Prorocentrum_lima.AAC.1